MKKIYLVLLAIIISLISTFLITIYKFQNDKESFLKKVEKTFEGRDAISDGNDYSIYHEYKILNPVKDAKLIEQATVGNKIPTAISTPLLGGFYYLQLSKNYEEDEIMGFSLDSIASYKIIYKGSISNEFQKSFKDKFYNFTESAYNEIAKNYHDSSFPGKAKEIRKFGEVKSKFHYLEKIGAAKKKPEDFFQQSYSSPEMALFFGNHGSSYIIAYDKSAVVKSVLIDFSLSLLAIFILIIIIFLILKIFKNENTISGV